MKDVEIYLQMLEHWSSLHDEVRIEKEMSKGTTFMQNFTKSDWEELIAQSHGRAKFEYTKMMKEKFPD